MREPNELFLAEMTDEERDFREERIAKHRLDVLTRFPVKSAQPVCVVIDDSRGELVFTLGGDLYTPGGDLVESRGGDYDTSRLGDAAPIAEVVYGVMARNGRPYSGGCRCFYTPEEWRERGEKYGLNAALIVCHDGGTQADYFNPDKERYDLIEAMDATLADAGCWAEPCTCWYTAIYRRAA